MCLGELINRSEQSKKNHYGELVIAILILFSEITFVGMHVEEGADRSMYLSLPIAVYFLTIKLKFIKSNKDTKIIRGISTAIYLMQFGMITVVKNLFEYFDITGDASLWMVWFAAIIGPAIFYVCIRKHPISDIMF